jgi:hypothetical protein
MLVIKGIGNAAGRVNEITPEFDARLLRWLAGYDKAILKNHLEEFAVTRTGNTVSVGSGLFLVYGYACYNSSIVTLTQQYGTGTSYAYVYLNIDLSESTARFEIKLTVPSSTDTASWTQNNLYTNPFGRYQQPIARLTITSSAITVTNLRDELLKPYPQYAKQADDYSASGGIATKFGGIDTSISTLNSTKAPLANPAFTGGYTINPNTVPTAESIVINLTGNDKRSCCRRAILTLGGIVFISAARAAVTAAIITTARAATAERAAYSIPKSTYRTALLTTRRRAARERRRIIKAVRQAVAVAAEVRQSSVFRNLVYCLPRRAAVAAAVAVGRAVRVRRAEAAA